MHPRFLLFVGSLQINFHLNHAKRLQITPLLVARGTRGNRRTGDRKHNWKSLEILLGVAVFYRTYYVVLALHSKGPRAIKEHPEHALLVV